MLNIMMIPYCLFIKNRSTWQTFISNNMENLTVHVLYWLRNKKMNCYRNKPFDTNSLQFFLYNITCYKIPSKSDDSGISPVAQKEHMESLCVFCQVAYSSISCSSIISPSHSGWNLWIHSLNVIWHQSPFFIDIFTHFLSQTQQNLRFLFLMAHGWKIL